MKTTTLILSLIMSISSVAFAQQDQRTPEDRCKNILKEQAELKYAVEINDNPYDQFAAQVENFGEKRIRIRVYQGHQGIWETVVELQNENRLSCRIENMTDFRFVSQEELKNPF